jgi:hypothetical protein
MNHHWGGFVRWTAKGATDAAPIPRLAAIRVGTKSKESESEAVITPPDPPGSQPIFARMARTVSVKAKLPWCRTCEVRADPAAQ